MSEYPLLNYEPIRKSFRELRENRETLIKRIQPKLTTQVERELLYLVTEESRYLLDEIEKLYLLGKLNPDEKLEFGNYAEGHSHDKKFFYQVAVFFSLEPFEDGYKTEFRFPCHVYNYVDFVFHPFSIPRIYPEEADKWK